ncbi:MAG: tetratricopeptide repeat protein [Calothrix sp. C42_A2020_038]|nr:tetratricopeptide repeat protein [Calothrix sp. C42_A2020_038]
MNTHTFLASDDEQHYSDKCIANTKDNVRHQEASINNDCIVGDGNLRSCALRFARLGDYREAISLLNQLLKRNPENAIDYNNRGLIYYQCGERQKAFHDYNTAIELNPKLASAYNNRANYYAAYGNLAAALDDYDEALNLNPTYTRAWINRGITLRDLGRYEESIDNFEVAQLFDQYEGHILAERGRTYHLWGDWNWAIADYRRALALLPMSQNHSDAAGWRLRLQVENWLGELLCS